MFRTVLLACILGAGCIHSPVDDGIAPLLPTLRVYKPASNDTIPYGRNAILYDVSDAAGIRMYELCVNDSVVGRFTNDSAGRKPTISWTLDSTARESRLRYYIRVFDLDNNSVTSEVMANILVGENTTPPVAPSNLVVRRLTATTVNLLWDDESTNEDNFELWRRTGSGAYERVQTLPRNVISTNDTGLAVVTQYRYKVRAVNRFGFAESNEASTIPDPNTAPRAPTGLRGEATGTERIEMQWTDNASNELAFVVERRVTSGTTFGQVALLPPNQTLFIDSAGLAAGTSYSYRVAARGQFGQSVWSNLETVVTLYQDIFPPTNLRAAYSSATRRVTLTWTDNTVLEIETRIERKQDSTGTFGEIGRTGTDTTSFADSTLQAGHTYYYRVRAYTTDHRYSGYSNTASLFIPTHAMDNVRRRDSDRDVALPGTRHRTANNP